MKAKKAFTIVELLICLAIVALIMTAAAIAFDACMASYKINSDISNSVIRANQALSRITADLRCASAVNTSEPNNQCSLITAQGDDITYLYNQTENKLYFVKNDTSNSYVLCENVDLAGFDRTTAFDANGLEYVKSVQITLTVGCGNFNWDVSTSVAIRRNL